MSRTYDNVLVFGASGAVGSYVALEAQKRGAKVWLAMRDPSKPLPIIPSEVEKGGNFVRVQADLADTASVAKAVAQSGAKAAYLYLVYNTPDFMRSALQAMRDNGVEHVVFLSTYLIKSEGKELRATPPTDQITYGHAQGEIAIEDTGFPYFTSLRPGWFASNYFRVNFVPTVKPPKATIVAGYESTLFDDITPEDIGAVGGAVLVQRPSDAKKETIWLSGPELGSAQERWETIKRITGRDDIDTTPITSEQYLEGGVAAGFPRPLLESLLHAFGLSKAANYAARPEFEVGIANIEKYAGRPAMKFADYVEAHKAEWVAA